MTSNQALVVDDSRSARKVLERMLQKANVSVSTVEDAESALEYLKNEVPGIIFMDHMMPGMNGLEATSELRKLPNLQHVPTIMYTSKDDADYLAQAKAHGADDVLPKPAKQDKLEALINLYLSAAPSQPPFAASDDHAPSMTNMASTAESNNTSNLDEKVVQLLIQQELSKFTPDVQKHIQTELTQTSKKWQEQTDSLQQILEQKLSEGLAQNKTNPSALFKTLQPVLQKLSLQIATKVVNSALPKATEALEEQLSEAQATISDLQNRQSQQFRKVANEQRQSKLVAYSALVISLAALVASAAVNFI